MIETRRLKNVVTFIQTFLRIFSCGSFFIDLIYFFLLFNSGSGSRLPNWLVMRLQRCSDIMMEIWYSISPSSSIIGISSPPSQVKEGKMRKCINILDEWRRLIKQIWTWSKLPDPIAMGNFEQHFVSIFPQALFLRVMT